MYAYAGNNPVMNVDPNGDSFLLAIIVITATMLTAGLISVALADEHSEDNVTVSGGSSPISSVFGIEFFGIGVLANLVLDGRSCNVLGFCQGYHQVGFQVIKIGISYTEYYDGSDSSSLSVGFFYLSLNNGNYKDIDSWGDGVSFGFTSGTYGGGTSGSIDIDIIGLLRDLRNAVKKGE